MLRLLKRPPVPKKWYKRAECRQGYDPEIWTVGNDGNDLAKMVCIELCPVREYCLRRALHEPFNYGVIRGGIEFLGAQKSRCIVCGLAVATGRQEICPVCLEYEWCKNGCGRMVHIDDETKYCQVCTASLEVMGVA